MASENPAGSQQTSPSLLAAFPVGEAEIRLVFAGSLDRASASHSENYVTGSGLKILEAVVHNGAGSPSRNQHTRVTLTSEPMNGHALVVDTVQAVGVRGADGKALVNNESRRFLQGIASIPGIQGPAVHEFPFASRFVGLVATASCQKDGGVNSNHLIDELGFCFIHVERGGPFNSLKVVGKKHVPGIDKEVERLAPQGLSPHVLWSGGEIQTVDGETRLVDTGFMEGSIMPATPKHFPPPYPIKTIQIAREPGSLTAKGLQGVIVRFENVTIDRVSDANKHEDEISAPHLRSFIFHDDSGAPAVGLLLNTVTKAIRPGQRLEYLRAIVHQPRPLHYEAIVEMNQHIIVA